MSEVEKATSEPGVSSHRCLERADHVGPSALLWVRVDDEPSHDRHGGARRVATGASGRRTGVVRLDLAGQRQRASFLLREEPAAERCLGATTRSSISYTDMWRTVQGLPLDVRRSACETPFEPTKRARLGSLSPNIKEC